jgi:antitoxin FitA
MHITCDYSDRMSKMIQLRDVPDALHRKLKARAALEGMSLSAYLVAEVRRAAERPSVGELRQRLAERTPVTPGVSPAEAVRAERDTR